MCCLLGKVGECAGCRGYGSVCQKLSFALSRMAVVCPSELNVVSLAENVVIAKRAAAIREMTTNSELQAHKSTNEGGGLI